MKYTEQTLRKKAYGIGYIIKKDYIRTLSKPAVVVEPVTGYTIYSTIDGSIPFMVAGYNELHYNLLSLEDVEAFLKEAYQAAGLVF